MPCHERAMRKEKRNGTTHTQFLESCCVVVVFSLLFLLGRLHLVPSPSPSLQHPPLNVISYSRPSFLQLLLLLLLMSFFFPSFLRQRQWQQRRERTRTNTFAARHAMGTDCGHCRPVCRHHVSILSSHLSLSSRVEPIAPHFCASRWRITLTLVRWRERATVYALKKKNLFLFFVALCPAGIITA